jgi:hypothetical protein
MKRIIAAILIALGLAGAAAGTAAPSSWYHAAGEAPQSWYHA